MKSTINLKVFNSDVMASTPVSIKTDPCTFINSGLLTLARNSIAARVNSLVLIAEVAANTARLDHDPITLAPKGMLIEKESINFVIRSIEFTNTAWGNFRTAATVSNDYPIFASGNDFLLSGTSVSGT